jgi:hypothetical protein
MVVNSSGESVCIISEQVCLESLTMRQSSGGDAIAEHKNAGFSLLAEADRCLYEI